MRTLRRRFCLAAVCAAWCMTTAGALELNTATQAEMEQVKGIGVALSERLLKEREKAPFIDWADLMARLAGVGPRLAQRLSDQGVTVDGQPFRPGAGGAPR